jgi:hypothetical protein
VRQYLKKQRGRGMPQVVQYQPSTHKALGSIFSTSKKKSSELEDIATKTVQNEVHREG